MTSLGRPLPPIHQLAIFDNATCNNRATDGNGTALAGPNPRFSARHDVSNGRLLRGLKLVKPFDIAKIEPCNLIPHKLVAFSEALAISPSDFDAWVHFYEHDYRFQQIWNDPERHLHRLSRFAGIISPDFSVCRNMPAADKIHNTHRNQLLGARLQADGANVIANVRISGRESIPYALAGVPRNSTVAIGLHGCTKDTTNRRFVVEEVAIICDELSPTALIVYGSDAYRVLDYPRILGIPVHIFPPDTFHRRRSRKGVA